MDLESETLERESRSGSTLGARPRDLEIEGMTCAGCVTRVERSLAAVPGVTEASVNLATRRARVEAGPQVPEEDLVAAVASAGYEARVVDEAAAAPGADDAAQAAAQRRDMITLAVAVLLTLPLVGQMALDLFGVPFA
ncbi:MAG: heavy metal-associated domain-containing protein, partial [Kiloniellales bacterium]|nr:heavy metal-associated domain-containing protein [Kiloniellales bacterium]